MALSNPLDFLKNISSSIRDLGVKNNEFKQAATQQNGTINKFIKDVSKIFGSQAKSQGDINETLGSLAQSSVSNSQKVDQSNSLLTQSITVQTQMLTELKELSKNMSSLIDTTNQNSSGGGISQTTQVIAGALSGLGLQLYNRFDDLVNNAFQSGYNNLLQMLNLGNGQPAASSIPPPTPVNATSERDGSPEESGVSNQIGAVGSSGQLKDRKGFIIHHTGGRGDVGGVINTLNQRGLSVQYVIDRDGQIHQLLPSGARASHMRRGQGVGEGLSNSNTEGVEIIARDDSDVLPVQVQAAKQLVAQLGYSPSQVYGHGEVNTHKQRTEGATVVSAIRGGTAPVSAADAESATGSTGLTGGGQGGPESGGAGIFDMFGPMTGDLSGILGMLGPAGALGGALIGEMNRLAGGASGLLGMIPGLGGLGAMNMMSGGGGGGGFGGGGGGGFGGGGGGEFSNANISGSTADILKTIRTKESGGDYGIESKSSSASGAYQFVDGTWQNLTKKYGIGTEYARAHMAPPSVQDAVAGKYVEEILSQNNNDINKVPVVWYTGNPQGQLAPGALERNKGLTPQRYQQEWLQIFNQVTGGKNNETQTASIQASDEREDITATQAPILRSSYAFTPVNVSEPDSMVAQQLQPSSNQSQTLDYIQNAALETDTVRFNQMSAPQQSQSTEIPVRDQARVSQYSRPGSYLARSSGWYEKLAGRMNYNESIKLWPNVLA